MLRRFGFWQAAVVFVFAIVSCGRDQRDRGSADSHSSETESRRPTGVGENGHEVAQFTTPVTPEGLGGRAHAPEIGGFAGSTGEPQQPAGSGGFAADDPGMGGEHAAAGGASGTTGGAGGSDGCDPRLNLHSMPPSYLLVNGRPYGYSPLVGVPVPPGTHEIVFIHHQHGRKIRSVVVDCEDTTVSVLFP